MYACPQNVTDKSRATAADLNSEGTEKQDWGM